MLHFYGDNTGSNPVREAYSVKAPGQKLLKPSNDWESPERGWLRKFRLQGSYEPQSDLTPSGEKTIAWLLTSLSEALSAPSRGS